MLHISLTHYMWATELGPWLMQWVESREVLAYSRHLYLVRKSSCSSLTLLGAQLTGLYVSSKWTDSNSLRHCREWEIYTDMTEIIWRSPSFGGQAGTGRTHLCTESELHCCLAFCFSNLNGGLISTPLHTYICIHIFIYSIYLYRAHISVCSGPKH